MKASLDKFQVLAVGEKTHDKMPTFKTGEAEIRCERTVKLLGVEFGYLLKFKGVVGWCEGLVYLTSLGRPTDIGLQLGKACYPCSG